MCAATPSISPIRVGSSYFLTALAAIAIVGAVGIILGGIGGFAVDIYNQLVTIQLLFEGRTGF